MATNSSVLEDPYYFSIEKRLIRTSVWIGFGVILPGMFWASGVFVLGFVVGAAISLLNFLWLKQGIDRLLSNSSESRFTRRHSNRFIIFKYFLRYALIGGILYAIFRFRFLDVQGTILGLFLLVAAIVFECITQVVGTLIEDWNGRA